MSGAASFLFVVILSAQAIAQIPRTADGKPDFSGYWRLPGRDLQQELGAAAIPFTAAGWAAWKNTDLKNDPILTCQFPGVPRIMGMGYPMQIVQTRDAVVMLFELEHIWRSIPLDGRPHDARLNPTMLGDSVGTWDGDHLTIDTVRFKGPPWTWLDPEGHQHSDALHVVERLRRAPEGILYQATIDDPPMYSKPWVLPERMVPPLKSAVGIEGLMEYSCNENNRDLEHLVSSMTVDYRWNFLHPRGMMRANPRGVILLLVLLALLGGTAVAVLYRMRQNSA